MNVRECEDCHGYGYLYAPELGIDDECPSCCGCGLLEVKE